MEDENKKEEAVEWKREDAAQLIDNLIAQFIEANGSELQMESFDRGYLAALRTTKICMVYGMLPGDGRE